jgi:hypothetical protein
MWMRCLAAVFLLALVSAVGAAAHTLPESGAVDGWAHDGPQRRFTAANLYGHINGGAELFLELGFGELLVQAYRNGDREITLERYRMESPLAALAVYLFKCGEETPWPEIQARNSSTRFQATILRGDCFVLVNSFSGDETLRPAMAGLAGKLLEGIPEARPKEDPFGRLPLDDRLPCTERLIRGEYSLQAIYTFGRGDVLMLGGELFGATADYRASGGGVMTKFVVAYPDEERAAAAMDRLRKQLDPALVLLDESENRLTFRDFKDRFGSAKQVGKQVRIVLSAQPE